MTIKDIGRQFWVRLFMHRHSLEEKKKILYLPSVKPKKTLFMSVCASVVIWNLGIPVDNSSNNTC